MKKASHHLAVFDLKGSIVKRLVKGHITSKTTTLKDQNLLKLNLKYREENWLNFPKIDRQRIMKAMVSDVDMLCKFNLMDYSLLLCIQKNPDFEAID